MWRAIPICCSAGVGPSRLGVALRAAAGGRTPPPRDRRRLPRGPRLRERGPARCAAPAREERTTCAPAPEAAAPAHQSVAIPSGRDLARFVAPAFCNVMANSSMSAVDKLAIGYHSTLQLAALG
ncbi:unnamed protein product [Prorocentrum cordatum]|uniref:Uncharacterized protein n=1 Tax=Prorocentrum cordatum TaxID=2364126 RepID=A0ABN9Y7W8_9DINO|nr:unnamed protein product [Polarella glacialis]